MPNLLPYVLPLSHWHHAEKRPATVCFRPLKMLADAYRSYLSEVRKEANLPTDRLIEKVNDWQSLRDSVSACVAKDTANRIHANYESEIRGLQWFVAHWIYPSGSGEAENFCGMCCSSGEQTSQYRQDTELMQSAAEAEPFFKNHWIPSRHIKAVPMLSLKNTECSFPRPWNPE